MSAEALATSAPRLKPKTGLTAKDRQAIAEKLGVVLADSYQLFIKTQGVHWNIAGPSFYGIHNLTESHYQNIYEAIDVIAERIRALGEKAPASYTTYGELSSITDEDKVETAGAMLKMLIADHETVCRSMREAIEPCEDKGDYVTADLLIERLAWHEEAIWMLRSITAG